MKKCGNEVTYYWWLRSVDAVYTDTFGLVYTSGSATSNTAYHSCGVAPGFDI